MRDRLIELLKQVNFDFGEECVACCEDGYKCTPMLEDFFADHLLANGVIVPPCKVGSKIYILVTKRSKVNLPPFTFIKVSRLTFLNLERVVLSYL